MDVYYAGSEADWEKINFQDETKIPTFDTWTVHYNHTHDTHETRVEATCDTDGYILAGCECGYGYVSGDPIPAHGHDWGEWETAKAAPCTEDGEEQRVCANDPSHVETRLIPATGKPTQSFKDVPADAYYADAVAWAVAQNVTNGTASDTFSPNDTCTRAQVVTFLWRAAGEPEPLSKDNPFTDVKVDAY